MGGDRPRVDYSRTQVALNNTLQQLNRLELIRTKRYRQMENKIEAARETEGGLKPWLAVTDEDRAKIKKKIIKSPEYIRCSAGIDMDNKANSTPAELVQYEAMVAYQDKVFARMEERLIEELVAKKSRRHERRATRDRRIDRKDDQRKFREELDRQVLEESKATLERTAKLEDLHRKVDGYFRAPTARAYPKLHTQERDANREALEEQIRARHQRRGLVAISNVLEQERTNKENTAAFKADQAARAFKHKGKMDDLLATWHTQQRHVEHERLLDYANGVIPPIPQHATQIRQLATTFVKKQRGEDTRPMFVRKEL